MNELLMVCCSLARPDRLAVMLESYDKFTAGVSDLVICIHPGEKNKYDLPDRDVIYLEPNYNTTTLNKMILELKPEYKYYGCINDDHVCRTQDWDAEMIAEMKKQGDWGVVHVNDLWPGSSVDAKHPSCYIISRNIVDAVGYHFPPGMRHFEADSFLRDLVDPLGLLFYRDDIVIEHMHYMQGKAKVDATYEWGYCAEEMTHGTKVYNLWRLMQGEKDRDKIREAMKNETKENPT